MYEIVLIRHGESAWNKENRFTGWTDVPLSEKGIEEARSAGRLLKAEGFAFDYAFTSVLKRAIKTLWLVLEEMDRMWIPVQHSWKLNERHYGALQGLNKADTAAKYGDAQVKIWRRSYDIQPPVLTKEDERYPGHDPRYTGLTEAELPLRHSCTCCPVLAGGDSPSHQVRQEDHHCCSRKLSARVSKIPRQHLREGHSGAQHPDRCTAGLRAERRP